MTDLIECEIESVCKLNQKALGLDESFNPNSLSGCYSSVDYFENIEEKIASVVRSLIKNHYLPDGNKRTAFATFIALCFLNKISVPDKDWGPIFESIASRNDSVEEMAQILFGNVTTFSCLIQQK